MRYSAYPEYSDPSVALGVSYPKAWRIERLRFSILSNPLRSEVADWEDDTLVSFVPMDAVAEQGGIDASQEKSIGDVYNGYTYFSEQDILIAKITPCFENGKGAIAEGLKNGVGFGTTEFHVLRSLQGISVRWLFYLTMSDAFRKIGASEMLGAGGQKRVPEDFIKNFRAGIPALTEQQQIAEFLDWKTGQIDALIAKKKELLQKLGEKRLAVITQAVTKGLNLSAPLCDSGISWLGDVPEHWEIGGFTKYVEHKADYRGKTPEKVREGVFLVTAKNIKSGMIDYESSQEYVRDDEYEYIMSRGLPKIGDLLFTTEAPLGEVANVDREDIALAQRVIKFRGEQLKLNNYFAKYWMMSAPFQGHLSSLATGSTAKGIKASKLFALRCVVPPMDEQQLIVTYLDVKLSGYTAMENKVQQAIGTLVEYRTALITAATTGKIDVRNVKTVAAA